jgi:hypothetical protein
MSYRVDVSSTAKAEADAAFLNFSQYASPEWAQNWYQQWLRLSDLGLYFLQNFRYAAAQISSVAPNAKNAGHPRSQGF